MTRAARLVAAAAVMLAATGCGDEALWTRWRAERSRWQAEREIQRLQLRPALATLRDFRRIENALDEVGRIAPLERWLGSTESRAREVAALSGHALVRRAELELMRGRRPEGILALERAFERTRPLPEVAREAARLLAQALDQASRDDEALAWWTRLATEFPPYDSATGEPVDVVLEAAPLASRRLRALGRDAAADSVLAACERRLAAALAAPAPGAPPPGERAWRSLGALRTLQGDPTGAMSALRAALPGARSEAGALALLLDLGRAALAAGWPDTARAYAALAGAPGGEPHRHALRITARAWELAGAPDSAIATWTRLIEEYPKAQDSGAEARFRRGLLYEGRGRWEAARTEYRALAATFPSHPLSFDALLRIVQHHVRIGEGDVARHEAERLVEAMDYLIATQHDDGVQRAARRTRGEALLAVGEHARAYEALADVWRRWPATTSGVESAWKAAEVAAGALENRAASDSLLAEIAAVASDPQERVRARTRLGQRAVN